MAKATYESLVKQGRQAAKSQWTLGDLAAKVETGYGEGRLQEYADDIGVSYRTLKDYRWVSGRYASDERSSLPWSVHQILAGQDDRAELVKDENLTAAAARAVIRGRKETSATPDLPPIEEDTWLNRAVAALRPVVEERTGLTVPPVRASIGWPLQKGGGTETIGQHWHGAADGVSQVYVSPELSDPERVLDVLTHELVHSALPAGTAHKQPFKVAATKVGLDGPAKETHAGPQLKIVLNDIAQELGAYPHSPITRPERKTRGKARESEPNSAKYACIDCKSMNGDGEGYYAMVTVPRGLLQAHGWPEMRCPIDGRTMEKVDD